MTITSFVTQLPLETNRIDLDPDVKDAWGLPAMRITSTAHADDKKNMEFFRQKVAADDNNCRASMNGRSAGSRRSESSESQATHFSC